MKKTALQLLNEIVIITDKYGESFLSGAEHMRAVNAWFLECRKLGYPKDKKCCGKT